MADLPAPHATPVQAGTPLANEDAFVADRQKFWGSFTSATTFAVIAVIVVVIGMALFLT